MSEKVDITIVGAGVIGCAVAYRIASETNLGSSPTTGLPAL
jgi:L-2-hydroxyglutarate oxidase LhgO